MGSSFCGIMFSKSQSIIDTSNVISKKELSGIIKSNIIIVKKNSQEQNDHKNLENISNNTCKINNNIIENYKTFNNSLIKNNKKCKIINNKEKKNEVIIIENDLIVKEQLNDILLKFKEIKNKQKKSTRNFENEKFEKKMREINKKINYNFWLFEEIIKDYENMRNILILFNNLSEEDRKRIIDLDYDKFISNKSQNIIFYKNIIEKNTNELNR